MGPPTVFLETPITKRWLLLDHACVLRVKVLQRSFLIGCLCWDNEDSALVRGPLEYKSGE